MKSALATLLILGVTQFYPQSHGQIFATPSDPEDYSARSTCRGYWAFDDASAAYAAGAADSCQSYTLTTNGDPAQTCGSGLPTGTGGSECYAALDGTGDYFSLASAGAFEGESALTFGCWAYQTVDGDKAVFSHSNVYQLISTGATTNGWVARVTDTPLTVGLETASTAIANATWYHLAVRFDNTETTRIEAFTNGTLDCSGACDIGETPSGNAGIGLGALSDGGFGHLTGRLHECWYMAEALSGDEICQIQRCGFRGTATDRGGCTMGALTCTN